MAARKRKTRKRPEGSGRRPTGPDGEARTHSALVLRLSEREADDLDSRAARAGASRSRLVRSLIWPAAGLPGEGEVARRKREAAERADLVRRLGMAPEDTGNPRRRYTATTGELARWVQEKGL